MSSRIPKVGSLPVPSEATRAAIRWKVAEDLRPVRSLSLAARGTAVLAFTALAAMIGMKHSGAARALGGQWGELPGVLSLAPVLATVLLGALTIVLGLGHFRAASRLGKVALGFLVVVSWFLYLGAFASTDGARTGAFTVRSLACAAHATLAGVAAQIGIFWVWRRSDPWTPLLNGALVGAVTGAVAAAGLELACLTTHSGHLLVGHGLSVVLLAVLGAFVGRRVLSP